MSKKGLKMDIGKAPLEIYFVSLGWNQVRAFSRMDCAEKSPKKYLFECEAGALTGASLRIEDDFWSGLHQ